MKIKRKLVSKYERMAYKYRHRTINRAENRHDLHLSKAQHPSKARSAHRQNASMETSND